MIPIQQKVMVLDKKQIMGFGSVIDICTNKQELARYFEKNHPHYASYQLAMLNNEHVYIVGFDNDNGQGGYLKRSLRKI